MMKVLFLILMLQVGSSTAFAVEYPAGWPWKGVSMDNLSSAPSDIERYKRALNINVVRLQLKPDKLAQRKSLSTEEAWVNSLYWLDMMLDKCQELNVKAIVNLSHFPINPSYSPNFKIRVAQYTPQFWQDDEQLNVVVNVVSRLIKHIKQKGYHPIAIDIMSEPAVREGKYLIEPQRWRELILNVVKEIRLYNPKIWIVISPPPQGKPVSYKNFKPIRDSHLIYGAHMYAPNGFSSQGVGQKKFGVVYPSTQLSKKTLKTYLRTLFRFEQKFGVPVLVGEFSAVRWANGGEQYIKDLTSIFDEYGWSWLYFSGTGWHGWNPDYNQHYPDKDRHGAWKKDYVGEKSLRWGTLREVFGVKQRVNP